MAMIIENPVPGYKPIGIQMRKRLSHKYLLYTYELNNFALIGRLVIEKSNLK